MIGLQNIPKGGRDSEIPCILDMCYGRGEGSSVISRSLMCRGENYYLLVLRSRRRVGERGPFIVELSFFYIFVIFIV